MAQSTANKKLARMIAYMLGRAPGEFGLVPDENGHVKLKEFLKALHEEEGWRHVRQAQLREVQLTLPEVPFEMTETFIRARDRGHLPAPTLAPAENCPALLYTCIRRKAHPRVAERGISPGAHSRVVLASDREMALRIGRRRDAAPVVLIVETARAGQAGVIFYQTDNILFLADFIPPGCFRGPALPREGTVPKKKSEKSKPSEPLRGKEAGSFYPQPPAPPGAGREKSGRKYPAWKKERRNIRRKKQSDWPDK